jgi:hypothetical protein
MNHKIAVVILNWNGAELLKKFLPSVIAYSTADHIKIVVADNGSTDAAIELIKNDFGSVQIIALEQNLGFAKGYNEALRQIDADYFVILNSDVEVTNGWLDAPILLMENDSEIAAVQPKILSFHQKSDFEYAGAAGGLIDRYGYPFCRGRIFNKLESDNGQYDAVSDIFWASGACMFVRASAFNESGGFDADFWAHMEEIDFCWRLKNKGYRIVFTPESKVYHLGGGTLSYDNPQKLYLNFRNNLWLLYKNLPGQQLFPILFVRMLLDAVAAIKLLTELNLNGIRSVLKAHFHFYQSIPRLHAKRSENKKYPMLKELTGKMNISLVYQFYIRKRCNFNELKS